MVNTKRYNHGYILGKKYTLTEVYDYVKEHNELPDKELYNTYEYNDSFKRINIIFQLFNREGCSCINCKEKSKYFAIGEDLSGSLHLDLYSDKDDTPYMYTIDHIFPKSKGGENKLENFQLLCKVCNENKSDNVIGEKPKETKKENFIGSKLSSLNTQTKAILTKIHKRNLVCVKDLLNFTVGKVYNIIDIKVKIDKKYNSKYSFYTKNDFDDEVEVDFKYFTTKDDKDYYINKKFNRY